MNQTYTSKKQDVLSRKRMYQNPILELLSYSSPMMMVPFHLTIISIWYYYGYTQYGQFINLSTLFGVTILGFLFWTFTEYVMHRFVFHLESENKIIKAFHYAMHGYHHSHPDDVNRLFMPPVPALIFLSLFFGVFYIFLGNYTYFFISGFDFGYLCYALMHYSMHKWRAPKNMKRIWHHHILHHYKDSDSGYGVSSTIWDRIFGTMPKDHLPD